MLVLSITLGLVLLLGLSYAFFTLTLTGTKQNVIKVGKLSLTLSEGDAITIENAVPTPMETALTKTPYHFEVTNDGTVEAEYTLTLKHTGTITEPYMFNYALKKDGQMMTVENLAEVGENDPFFKGTILPGATAIYDLYIWLDYNDDGSTISDGQYYEGTLSINAYQQKPRKLTDYVYRACDGQENCMKVVGDDTYFHQSYYGNTLYTKYVWYSGNLWFITGYDQEGNMRATSASNVTYIPWGPTVNYKGSYVEHWLQNEFLPTLNDYQKFLVTDYPWNYSTEVTSNSSTFDGQIGTDKIEVGPVGLLNKRDLFYGTNGDDTYNGGDTINYALPYYSYVGTPTTEGYLWVSGMGFGAYGFYVLGQSHMPGVAPSVVFRKDVVVLSGSGTEKDPYLLKGDTRGKSGDLLNERKGGEYVAFGDGLNNRYRIVKSESGYSQIVSAYPLTKVQVTGDQETYKTFQYSSSLTAVKDNRMPYVLNGENALGYNANSTNYPIAYLLNHDFLNPLYGYLSNSNLSMIETNQTWYTSTLTGSDNYENIKDTSKKVTATVALPSLGDSYTAIEKYESTFISTVRNSLLMTNNGSTLYLNKPLSSSGAIQLTPTFYLKSSVKIKSGNGTKLDPYILTME